jgi:hypothetical protein
VSSEEKAGPRRLIHVALPGTSGFPTLSKDEQYIYFSHYLNDTNQDGIIDGNDNSVLFRLPVSKLPEKGDVFPEQLTLAESNCSYPRISGDKLLATCASGGTLDLFELPATGVVPAHWDAAKIWNAHRTARTYAERILLLSALKYRFPNQISELAIDERLLSDHMLAGDSSAARYYAKKLQKASSGEKASLYELAELLLAGLELKGLQENDDVTRDFEQECRESGPLYRLSAMSCYEVGFAGVSLGIARSALDAFIDLARNKVPRGQKSPLRDNAVVQSNLAQAEAGVQAARALLLQTVGRIWDEIRQPQSRFSKDQRIALRMASTHAIHQSREAVDMAYNAAGTTAIFQNHELSRRFRDMHTVTQQVQGRMIHFETVGQHLLGMSDASTRFA